MDQAIHWLTLGKGPALALAGLLVAQARPAVRRLLAPLAAGYGLAALLTAVLIATTVGATIAATYFRSLARREFLANQKSQEAQKEAEGAKAIQFQLARMANRRRFELARLVLEPIEADYDRIMTAVARFA